MPLTLPKGPLHSIPIAVGKPSLTVGGIIVELTSVNIPVRIPERASPFLAIIDKITFVATPVAVGLYTMAGADIVYPGPLIERGGSFGGATATNDSDTVLYPMAVALIRDPLPVVFIVRRGVKPPPRPVTLTALEAPHVEGPVGVLHRAGIYHGTVVGL